MQLTDVKSDNSNAAITNLIEKASHIAVVPSRIYGANAFCAAVGIYYMLTGKQKEVYFIHTGKVPDICADLISREEITSNVSQRELQVSIDYSNTQAAKVHYATENDVLKLTLSPIPKDYDKNKVKTEIVGFDFDLIFTIGVQDMEDLGQIYKELEKEFRNTHVINLDNTNKNQRFGVTNIIDPSANSLSSLVLKKAAEWNMYPDEKSARALLLGITYKDVKIDSR